MQEFEFNCKERSAISRRTHRRPYFLFLKNIFFQKTNFIYLLKKGGIDIANCTMRIPIKTTYPTPPPSIVEDNCLIPAPASQMWGNAAISLTKKWLLAGLSLEGRASPF
ncbi:MAG: hypothetical protein AUJ72_05505 [Candidatus Omnitrophica bacterium CG1_02_46_14]|nr:MAG: hypothetical protein AUJ72_05505 [Candidatus Omnitrophica bacterium CG1_02_46_14]